MTTGALLGLVRLNLRRGRRGFILSMLGVALGIASLVFFLSLSHGIERVVLGKIFPIGQVEIVEKKSGGLDLFGGPKALDDRFVEQVRAHRDVARVYRKAKLSMPARAWGGQQLLGREVRTELVAEGLDPVATKGDDLAPLPFTDPPDPSTLQTCNADSECPAPRYCPWDTHRCETPVPAVISPFLLDLYNTTIAKPHGLPQMGTMLANRFRGITFTIELGRSFLGGALGQTLGVVAKPIKAEPHQRRVMVVGLSPAASRLALSMPLGYVRAWNKEYLGDAAGEELSSVVAILKDGASSTKLIAFARSSGYDIADSGAEQAGLAITLMTALFSLVSLVILLVAAMNISHSFFRAVAERRRELGLLRAMGATQRDLASLLLTEAAVLGLAGGIVGIVLARAAALVIDLVAARAIPDFSFKPDTFFSFDLAVLALGLAASLGACLLGAIWPARLASRVDPAAALQGN